MKTNASIEFRLDSFNLLNFLIKYRKQLIITGLVAAVLSVAFTFLITPRFKSVVVIFPTPNVIETRSLLNTQNSPTEFFGNETATEMVLQIIESDKINDYLIKKYNLFEYYKIDDQAYKRTILEKKMMKNILSRKTQFNSIEITVFDTDPEVAAGMANDIAWQVDTVFNSLRKEAEGKSLAMLKELYNNQYKRVSAIEDSLRIPLIGVGGKENSAQALMSAEILSFFSTGNSDSNVNIISQLQKGTPNTPEYFRLINAFVHETNSLSVFQQKLLEVQAFANKDLQYIYFIKNARVAEIKATPERSIIVAVSTISTLFLMFILLLLLDPAYRNEK